MARRYANFWSDLAAGLTAMAHTRASIIRWGVVIALSVVWIGGGLWYWWSYGPLEAVYRTLSAVAMWDNYFRGEETELPLVLEIVRFAALAAPVVGLLFAFSGQLGRSLAQIFNLGAAKHVVVAGDTPAALTLAADCRRHDDAVILISDALAEETVLGLRRRGIVVVEGEASHVDTLKAARAHRASHVVAFEADDTMNLQIEAAVRGLVGSAKRKPPIGVHVSTRSPLLLREAREMRAVEARKRKDGTLPAIDPKPFSLDEMSARSVIQSEAQTLLNVSAQLVLPKLHLVFFGFDDAGEALAVRALMSLWSVRFGAPRITVLSPNPAMAESRFRARHREGFAHPHLWSADIAFLPFDWDHDSVGSELFDRVEAERGKPSAVVVSTGGDPGNIQLAIGLKRICNHGLRWPVPIYMKESSQSEFSREYARGDDTPELDAYLQAFGAHQVVATRGNVLDGMLDRGAAIAHEYYNKHLGERGDMAMRELQAAMKHWADVFETYRAANRAVADAALVKVWDAGWRPAAKNEKGETAPTIDEALLPEMARIEHDRWMAERLMSGWRPSETRNNDLMMHDKLAPWSAMTEDDKAKDAVQVRAAIDIARVLHPKGFVARG